MVITQLDIFNGHVQLASTISLLPERTPLISYASYSLVRKIIMHSYNEYI